MINQQLIQYIMQSLQQGYDYNSIRTYLIQNGWPQQDIDETIFYVQQQFNYPSPSNQIMQSPDYKIPTHHNTVVHLSNQTMIVIGGSVAVISIIIVLMFTLFGGSSNDKLLDNKIHLSETRFEQGKSISFSNIVIDKGKKKRYDITSKYKIIRNSDMKIMKTGEKTTAIEGTISIPYNIPTDESWIFGAYIVEIDIIYGGHTFAPAKESFEIIPRKEKDTCKDNVISGDETDIDCGGSCPKCEEEKTCKIDADCKTGLCNDNICTIKIQKDPNNNNLNNTGNDINNDNNKSISEDICKDCDDNNPCTEDFCIEGNCINKEIFPCCGNSICEGEEDKDSCPTDCAEKTIYTTEAELRTKAEDLAKEDHIKAAKFCQTLEQINQKDHCFYVVAYSSEKMDICKYIEKSTKADTCYMKFISQNKDYGSCHYIQSDHLRSACESLGRNILIQ
jgi:hypothetical protein